MTNSNVQYMSKIIQTAFFIVIIFVSLLNSVKLFSINMAVILTQKESTMNITSFEAPLITQSINYRKRARIDISTETLDAVPNEHIHQHYTSNLKINMEKGGNKQTTTTVKNASATKVDYMERVTAGTNKSNGRVIDTTTEKMSKGVTNVEKTTKTSTTVPRTENIIPHVSPKHALQERPTATLTHITPTESMKTKSLIKDTKSILDKHSGSTIKSRSNSATKTTYSTSFKSFTWPEIISKTITIRPSAFYTTTIASKLSNLTPFSFNRIKSNERYNDQASKTINTMTPPKVTTVRATTESLKHMPYKSTSLYNSTKLATVFHKYDKFLTSKNTSASTALSNVDISINDSKTLTALSRSGSLHYTKNGDTFTTTTRTGSKPITSLAVSKSSKDNKAIATITIIHEPVVTSDPVYTISLNASTSRDIIYSVTKSTRTGSPTVTSSNNCKHTRILEATHSLLNISTALRSLCTNSEATTTKATPTSFPVITLKRSSNSGTRISSAKNTRNFPATIHVYRPIATVTNHLTAKDIYSKSFKITPVAIKTSDATLTKNSNLTAASILAFTTVNNSISNTLTSSIPPFIATGLTSPTKTTFSKSNYFSTKTTSFSSAAANGFFSATPVSSHSIIKTTKTVGSDTNTKPIYSSTITPGSSTVVFDTYPSPTSILLSAITNSSSQIIKVPDFSAVTISDSSTYTFRRKYTASPSSTFCKGHVSRPIVTTSDIPYASIINAPSMNATDCSFTTISDALYTASTGSLGIAPTTTTKNIPSSINNYFLTSPSTTSNSFITAKTTFYTVTFKDFSVTATHTMQPDSMKEPYETTRTYPTVLSYSLSAGNEPRSTTTTNSSMVVLASPTGVSSKEDYTSDNEKVTIPSIIKSEGMYTTNRSFTNIYPAVSMVTSATANDTISHSYTSRAATSSTVMYSENSSTAYMHLPTLAHRPILSDTTISNLTTNVIGTLTTDTLATTATTTTTDTVTTIDTTTTTDTVTTVDTATTFDIAATIDTATITDTESTTETQMTTATQDNTIYTYKYETLSWLSQSFYYNTKGTTTFLAHTKTRGSTQPSMTSEESWSHDLESENESDSSTISNSSENDSSSSDTSSGRSSTEEVQNIFECPQFITPNDDVIIPDSSRFTYLRILHLPYDVLLDNSIMSTALAQDIPIVFSHALAMSANNFIVISIGKSNSSINDNQARKRSDDPAVIVTMAVPPEVVEPLQTLISTPNSKLYTMGLGQLPTMIDRTYPVAKELKDFNQLISKEPPSNSKTESGGLPRNSIIGICVGIGISVYAAGTIAGIKYYRQRKSKKEKIMKEQHIMFADSILSPITQSWVPIPYENLNTRT